MYPPTEKYAFCSSGLRSKDSNLISSIPVRNDAVWNDAVRTNDVRNDALRSGVASSSPHDNVILSPDGEGSSSNRRPSHRSKVKSNSLILEGSSAHASVQNPSHRVARRRSTIVENTLPGSHVVPPPSSSSSTTTTSSSTPTLYNHLAPPVLPFQLQKITSSLLEDGQQDFLQKRRALAASFLHSDKQETDSIHKRRTQVCFWLSEMQIKFLRVLCYALRRFIVFTVLVHYIKFSA